MVYRNPLTALSLPLETAIHNVSRKLVAFYGALVNPGGDALLQKGIFTDGQNIFVLVVSLAVSTPISNLVPTFFC